MELTSANPIKLKSSLILDFSQAISKWIRSIHE